MTTTEAFLDCLNQALVKARYPNPSIRNWRSRAKREMVSVDFMSRFLLENGYELIQDMRWSNGEKHHDVLQNGWVQNLNEPVHHNGNGNGHLPDEKTQLRKKLYALRQQMDTSLIETWFETCGEVYRQDFPEKKLGLTNSAFYQMTSGRHFSKDNTIFAIKVLKQGKHLLQEYSAHIRMELENV